MRRLKLFTCFLCLFFIGFNSYSQSQPNESGQWSDIIEFDIVPVAIANLPDGRLVTWSSKYHDDFGGDDGFTYTQIFDPTILDSITGNYGGVLRRTVTDTDHDMFCPGITNLADGRIMVTGGSSAERTSIYDPKTQKWSRAADLNIPRGYQGAVTLGDGSVFTIGGSWSGDATYGGRYGELWAEGTGWASRTGLEGELLWNQNDFAGEDEGEYRLDNHAWLWAAPNGKIFHAGPGEEMHWLDVSGDDGNGSYEPLGKRSNDYMSMNGTTAMFDIGKILKVGGSASYSSGTPSNSNSYVIDINNEHNVTVTPTANNMARSRIYVSSVVLPNGEVLVMGGMDTAEVFSDTGAHLSAEMFNPDTNEFRTLASMQVPRTYHSAGILLMDGRVFMGGGGLCGTCGDVNHMDAEIYSPPYLFNSNGELAARPTLNAPDKAYYETPLVVTASEDVTEFVFMRMSSATHSINNEQRRVPVDYTENEGYFHLEMRDANLMPPGYYMLFALNENGVPSLSKAVLVGAPESKIQADNLLVEFDFFEGQGNLVRDISGHNNHGTIKERDDNGDPLPLDREYWSTDGLSGNALEMDGIEHYSNSILEIPNTPQLTEALTNQITVMAWVNRDTGSVVRGTTRPPNVSIFSHDYTGQSFFMGYHAAEFKVEFWTDAEGHFDGYTGVNYKPGEWQHFVATYDGEEGKVYVNGEMIHQEPVTGNLLIVTDESPYDAFTLSGFYDRRPRPGDELPESSNRSGITDELDGRMDNFKLYNIALTETEIQRIYNAERKIVINDDPCDDIALVYDINGKEDTSLTEIFVQVGDTIALSLDVPDIAYTVTYEDETTPLNSHIITGITSEQAGKYTLDYALKRTLFAPNLEVLAVDSYMPDPHYRPGSYAIDGLVNTHWHTEWNTNTEGHDETVVSPPPHWIIIDLGEESNVSGLEYLPRHDDDTHGTIADYEIYVGNSESLEISEWGNPVTTGTWTWDVTGTGDDQRWVEDIRQAKMVNFPETSGRYVRLLSRREVDGRPFTSAAEIRIEITENTYCSKDIDIDVHTPKIYTYTDQEEWSDGDPSGESTKFDDIIIESGQKAVITTNTLVNNLTIEAGAALTVGTNVILTLNNITLKSTSNSFASLIDNGWVAAAVNYERWVNKMGDESGGGNDLISSPVTNALFDVDFVTANPSLPEHPETDGIFAFAPFNVSTNKYENFNIGSDYSGSIPVVSGSGYRAATTNGDQLVFRGQVTRIIVKVPISDDAAGRAWNLIGNPYPSYLDFTTFFNANVNEFGLGAYQAIYGYKGTSSDKWEVWNQATIEASIITKTIPLIAPGQGFFVKAKPGGGSVQFVPAMRKTGTTDDFIVGRPSKNIALSKLKLSRTSGAVSTSIYFIDGTSKGLDPGYDAASYNATTVDFSLFTNLVEDHTGLDIAIQSLPYEDVNNVTVPLGIKATAGEELSIGIDELSTLPSNINVYLEDTQNNTLTLLNDDAYVFTLNGDMNGAGRFNIHYSAKTLSIADLDVNDNLRIYATASPKTLFIIGQLTSATTANLYDLQGRLVRSQILNPYTTENTMDIASISTGVYVVKVNNDSQIKTQKVIIK